METLLAENNGIKVRLHIVNTFGQRFKLLTTGGDRNEDPMAHPHARSLLLQYTSIKSQIGDEQTQKLEFLSSL